MEEKKQIFRKSSLERLGNPEKLNDYIQLEMPAAWMLMVAVCILLFGAIIWSVFGTIESRVKAVAVSNGVETIVYMPKDKRSELQVEQTIEIGEHQLQVRSWENEAVRASDHLNSFGLHILNTTGDTWLYRIHTDGTLEIGVYEAEIITERINPIAFIISA